MAFKDKIPTLATAESVANVPAYTVALRDALVALGFRPSWSGITPPATITAGSWTSQNITFPPGLFTTPPRVVVTGSDGKVTCSFNPSAVTKDGATIFGESRSTATLDNIRLTWFAIEQ